MVRGRVRVTSRVGKTVLTVPEAWRGRDTTGDAFYVATPHMDADALPTTTIAVPLENAAWIVAEISLEELWRTVDRIRVGTEGYALLIDQQGKFIAHGNPNDKELIASGATAAPNEQKLAESVRRNTSSTDSAKFPNRRNENLLAVAAAVENPQWTVLVEQPTSEAFAVAHSLERQLLAAIAIALLGTIVLGWVWGRSFIQRIFALTRVTRAIAEGNMDERVVLSGQDEIRQLGDAFNSMADRLVELQENVRKQERQAMFGRIAAGLVHDLSHPIQNIGNSCKLIRKMFEDAEYRETFRRTIERELRHVKRVLDDLRNIARPIPLERFPIDVNRTVAEVVESMQQHAETAGLTLRAELTPDALYHRGRSCSRSAASTAT